MKLSKETLALLKYAAGLNQNIMLRPGNQIQTMSTGKNVLAFLTAPDTFPADFGLYDLGAFLGAVSLFEDPEVTFEDKFATISQGKNKIKFFASDPSILLLPPNKQFKFPGATVEFDVTSDLLNTLTKTASVLKAPDISFIGDGTTVRAVVSDLKNATGNTFDVDVAESSVEFQANFKVASLALPAGDYHLSISDKKISHWATTGADVYVTLETTSTFG